MNPPRTGISPRAVTRRHAFAHCACTSRPCRAAATMCSASVTSTSRASTHTAGKPLLGERGRDDPAARQLAHRHDRVVVGRRHVRWFAASALTRPPSSANCVCSAFDQHRRPARPVVSARRDRAVPLEQFGERAPRPPSPSPLRGEVRRANEAVGHLRQRRHDDHRRRSPCVLRLPLPPDDVRRRASSRRRRRPTCRRTS